MKLETLQKLAAARTKGLMHVQPDGFLVDETPATVEDRIFVVAAWANWDKIAAVLFAAENFATGQGDRVALIKALMALEE